MYGITPENAKKVAAAIRLGSHMWDLAEKAEMIRVAMAIEAAAQPSARYQLTLRSGGAIGPAGGQTLDEALHAWPTFARERGRLQLFRAGVGESVTDPDGDTWTRVQ